MELKLGTFDEGYAWMLVEDGHIIDQGYSTSMERVNSDANTAVRAFQKARVEAGDES